MRLVITTGGGAERALARLRLRAPAAVARGLKRSALLLGAMIARNVEGFKQTPGTRRLSRSFLIPVAQGLSTWLLGAGSPVYAGPHEFGAVIRAKDAPYLVFRTPDGAWHSVKEVRIREKRYARDAIEEFDRASIATRLIGSELAREFNG